MMVRTLRPWPLAVGVAVVVGAWTASAGCADPGRAGDASRGDVTATTSVPPTVPSGPSAAPSPTDPSGGPVAEEAAALVDHLVVTPETGADSYDRDMFGGSWIDADGDGCDTRAEVLITESRTPAQVDPYGCGIVAGDWVSTYDGYTTPDPTELEIDHVVALAEAWRSGASQWDDATRLAYANDLDEPTALAAVTAATNQSKSDRDPASWQPPDATAWCAFATAWVTVKVRWGLTADRLEVDTLRNMLAAC